MTEPMFQIVRDAYGARIQQAQDAGMASARPDPFWRDTVRQAIEYMADTGEDFQAADLVALGVPEPSSPAMWGPAFSAAARRGVIKCVGFAPSKRVTVAGSVVRVWRGAQW